VLPAPVSTLLLLPTLLFPPPGLETVTVFADPPPQAAASATEPVASNISADLRNLCMRDLSSSFTSDAPIVPVVWPPWGYSAVNVW
jgi:hypothetical protein